MAVEARTVLVTRMGVGIFDPVWWRTRLGLFNSITAASVAHMGERDLIWAILVDSDLPSNILGDIHDVFDAHGLSDRVRFRFVPDHSRLSDTVREAIRAEAHPRRRVHAQMLDDDDAISARLHDAHLGVFEPDANGAQVATTPRGLGIDAPRGNCGELVYPSHVPNSSFFGFADEVGDLMLSSHRKWLRTAAQRGGLAHSVESPTDDWLYLYHRQGDGEYESRIAQFGDAMRALEQADLDPFGIDLGAFIASVRDHESTPATMGLTWRRTQPQQYELLDLRKRTQVVKEKCIRINSDIFGDSEPFFYARSPLPGKRMKPGRNEFFGVGTPGTRIELWVRGSKDFKQMGTAVCDADDGSWSIEQGFRASRWGIELRQFDGDNAVNTLSYTLRVV
ncbi:glycosyltransferase [Brevibacterium zhoupengii]|uniref:glycosyltransferase n=1 Tax=Brevibacterium zhoupengii TaxID=2898795 RepID=UPI001E589345|nr:glycosyltransferase [Brevibacterium zhoupengii]